MNPAQLVALGTGGQACRAGSNRGATMQHILVALALAMVIAFSSPACADLTGQVINIAEGDNMTVIIDKQWVRVRLAGIEAPEINQPFGMRSRKSLSDLCFWQQVVVTPKGKDQYGRMLAKVRCGDVDAGTEQVKRGMAWIYDQYVKDASLKPIQEEAKAAKRGLWSDPYARPPWQWREMWD